MPQWPAVAAGLVQVARSSAGVVGNGDQPGRGGEVPGAGKRCQVTAAVSESLSGSRAIVCVPCTRVSAPSYSGR